MIAFSLTNTKEFMSCLLLSDTFDHFSFIEGEIVTFNTFQIDGYIQKDFFDTDSELPGKRTPLSFRFIFSLSRKNIGRLISQSAPALDPESVQGLYLNIHYEGARLSCVTGTSFKTFSMDKTLEHAWDEMVEKFLKQKNIEFEKM